MCTERCFLHLVGIVVVKQLVITTVIVIIAAVNGDSLSFIIPSLHCLRLNLPYHLLNLQLCTHLSLPYAKLSGRNMTQFVLNPPFQLKPYKTLTNSKPKKSAKWRKTNQLKWRSYLQRSVSLHPPSNRVEDGVDLEGEREGRRHGGRVEWGVEEKRMGGEVREGWLGGPVLG